MGHPESERLAGVLKIIHCDLHIRLKKKNTRSYQVIVKIYCSPQSWSADLTEL